MTNYMLIHGGFVDDSYWSAVAKILETEGHRVHVPEQLPSGGNDPTALGDLAADVVAIRAALRESEQPVVLVAHSSAGAAVTELADDPAVSHTVYVAALVPEHGQSAMDVLIATGGPSDWVIPGDDGALRAIDDLDRLREVLCADVAPDRARRDLAQMGLQSMSSAFTPSTRPERAHPVTYIVADNDVCIPRAAQEAFAASADYVEHLPSSHRPMVSMSNDLAAVLSRIS